MLREVVRLHAAGEQPVIDSQALALDPFGDPQRRNLHGFNALRFKGSPFLIGEVSRAFGGEHQYLRLVGGAWVHFDRFQDMGGGAAHAHNYSVYAIADARLWERGERSLHGFIRASASPSDRNPVDLYGDAGLTLSGPFPGRPEDTLAIAAGFARLSPPLRSLVRRRMVLAGLEQKVPAGEGVLELSYQLKLSPRAYLQPDAQWIIHPAGWTLQGNADVRGPKPNALVIGLRSSLVL